MSRRIVFICSLVVAIGLVGWIAYAYVQGAPPFANARSTDARTELAAAVSAVVAADAVQAGQAGQCAMGGSGCQQKCSPGECQKCPSMKDGKCTNAGNCICPKGDGACRGMQTAGGQGMPSGCPMTQAQGCQGAKGTACQGMQTAGGGKCAGMTPAAQGGQGGGCPGSQAAVAKGACGGCPLSGK